jgi:hypothetical protein
MGFPPGDTPHHRYSRVQLEQRIRKSESLTLQSDSLIKRSYSLINDSCMLLSQRHTGNGERRGQPQDHHQSSEPDAPSEPNASQALG